MAVPEGHFEIHHGKLAVNVPRNIFRKGTCEPIPEKTEVFKKRIMDRYPWLSEDSWKVLMSAAIREMCQILDEESSGRAAAKKMDGEGRTEDAIRHLEIFLKAHPDDPDGWYMLGELLCKIGKTEEGYRAFAEGRKRF